MNSLEHKVADSIPRPLLPCDYFDLIGGTSTGGLIAVMLGTLRMDVDSCIKEYLAMAPNIFPIETLISGNKFSKFLKGAKGKARFDSKPMEQAIKNLVQTRLRALGEDSEDVENTHFRFKAYGDQQSPTCKVFVCVTSEEIGAPFLIRSYDSPWAHMDDCPIWQACRATSAAPTFFAPMYIGNPARAYVDGGLKYNNPIRMVMQEARKIWPSRDPGCIISVGTGMPELLDVGRTIKPLLEFLIKQATDTERSAEEFKKEMSSKYGDQQRVYFRFNVQRGLEKVGLEEWKEFGRTITATEKYLHEESDSVDACASQICDPKVPNSTETAFIFNIRYERDRAFVGREDIITHINEVFSLRSRAAISGMGGVGKSQIAIEYAYRTQGKQPRQHFFWVYSATAGRFEESYKEIAQKLNIPGCEDPQNDVKSLVRHWLDDKNHGDWLMVLDNADDRSIFFPEYNVSNQNRDDVTEEKLKDFLFEYLPSSATNHGKILITTRDNSLGSDLTNHETPVAVQPFNSQDAETLLRSKINIDQRDLPSAKLLLEKLGYLPLAIAQAAAYVKAKRMSLREYLYDLNKNKDNMARFLTRNFPDTRRDLRMPSAVCLTWQISYEHIRRKEPRAADYLCLMAYLDNQAVPTLLLAKDKSFNEEERSAIGTLMSFSLITAEIDEKAYSMHPLVQLSTQTWVHEEERRWQAQALSTLSIKSPPNGDFETWGTWRSLLPHAMAVLHQGKLEDCKKLHQDITAIRKRVLGEDNLETLRSIHNLAAVLMIQGSFRDAEKLFREAEESRGRLLGVDHPDTLLGKYWVANAISDQGKWSEAMILHSEVLQSRSRVLGTEHQDTLRSMKEVAKKLGIQRKFEESKKILIEVVEKQKANFGNEHYDTLASKNELALVFMDLGNLREAEKLLLEVIHIRKRQWGNNHHESLTTRHNLALLYDQQGRLTKAEELYRQVLDATTRVHGPEHPNTLNTIHNLAWNLYKQDRLDEATEMIENIVAKRKAVIGDEHPDTLSSMHQLSICLSKKNRLDEAILSIEDVIAKRKAVLGVMHPNTLNSMHELSVYLSKKDRLDEAILSIEDVIAKRKAVLGVMHPNTLNSMHELSVYLSKKDRLDEAILIMVDIIAKRKAVIGDEHLDTLNAIKWLEFFKNKKPEQRGLEVRPLKNSEGGPDLDNAETERPASMA
ncbi:kinesin light chain [Phlyctema vagabunda]|uniref:Kinesin light chain n=1 Tax=Phlyctema vagabunda TaxID=108571 RepID=A0ABR4PG49_9HELO